MAHSIWGKLGGAGMGFALGGPLGALLGALVGHVALDRPGMPLGPPEPDVVFTAGLVALSAKMARADGVVTQDEVAAFRRIVEIPPGEERRVQALFELAHQTTAGFEGYARQLAELLADRRDVLEDVLDGLFHIATADHAVHEDERDYLRAVATIFGFSDDAYATIEARYVTVPDDPYRIIGARRDMADAELKRLYRRLVAEHHPDRHIAHGLPPEAVKIATDRLAAINAAWERIARERRL